MDSVLRAVGVYAFVLILVRLSGRRTVGDVTLFDFVLLLLVAEGTQQALLGDDFSVTNGLLVVATLFTLDIGLSELKQKFGALARIMEGTSLIIIDDGRVLEDRMRKARVGVDDVMEQARKQQGIESLDQIKFAVIERDGAISVIAR
ncbi:MAG: DUF421 domain-containing protein [Actinomycetota bacterium]|nr:DUF421 domain-containing protein [Actinomycetota bacterium]